MILTWCSGGACSSEGQFGKRLESASEILIMRKNS